jgi:hypothetical protein
MLGDGVSENFLERFRTLAARAGAALGSPKDTDPEDFWLHRLYLDLREHNSDQLFAASEAGGAIRRVCVASSTFCSRLERKRVSVAASANAAPSKSERHAQLGDRELRIWAIIQRGARGPGYCRELDSARIAPPRKGIWKDCPRRYESAYRQGEPWRYRIQDEKSRVRRKAELAGLTKLARE